MLVVTLICEEVGQSGICKELRELLVESGFVHEGIVRPFAWPDLRPTRNVEVAVRGVPKDSLGIPLRGTPPEKIHFLYEQISENFGPQNDVNKTSQD